MSARTDVIDNLDLHEALADQADRLGSTITALRQAEMCLRRALENWEAPEAAHANCARAYTIVEAALR